MYLFLLLLAVLTGPLLYILVSLTGTRPRTYDEYHYAGRTISPESYVDSTVAYALQVAVLTLFATWGFLFGVWTIWVPIFWGGGYYLLSRLVERGTLDGFLRQKQLGTIHQFLSDKSQFPLLGALAALASLLGIAGPAMYEAEFAGKMVARLGTAIAQPPMESDLIDSYAVFFFAGFLILSAAYMLYGGFLAIVRTDVYQLAIGYCCFSVAMALLLYDVGRYNAFLPSLVILLIFNVMSIGLFWYWKSHIYNRTQHGRFHPSMIPLLVAIISYALSLAAILISPNENKGDIISGNAWYSIWKDQQAGSPFSLGFFSLLSLLIANGLYQIVDIGQWQRLGSVKLGSDFEASRRTLVRAIRVIMVYSPASWLMAILFGMTLRYVSVDIAADPYDAFSTLLLAYQGGGEASGQLLVLLFVVAIIAIMLSTVDSLVSCITLTIHNDWLSRISQRFRTLGAGRICTVVFLVMSFVLYRWLASRVTNFADVLYCCWSFQIALFPVVIAAFLDRLKSGWIGVLSVLLGMIGAVAPVLIGDRLVPQIGFALTPYEHSPILALLLSSLVLIVFGTLGRGAINRHVPK